MLLFPNPGRGLWREGGGTGRGTRGRLPEGLPGHWRCTGVPGLDTPATRWKPRPKDSLSNIAQKSFYLHECEQGIATSCCYPGRGGSAGLAVPGVGQSPVLWPGGSVVAGAGLAAVQEGPQWPVLARWWPGGSVVVRASPVVAGASPVVAAGSWHLTCS